MTGKLLQRMSTEEKVNLLLHAKNKALIRNFCGISQSRLLMLELSSQNALRDFLKNKIEHMPEELFERKMSELTK